MGYVVNWDDLPEVEILPNNFRKSAAGLKSGVNRIRIEKASYGVKPGDVITVTASRRVRVLRVLAAGTRRGPPSEARALYEELTAAGDVIKPQSAPSGVGRAPSEVRPAQRPLGSGRPTKKERREIDRLNGKAR